MSNIIDFLEKMGQDAQLRHTSHSGLGEALANSHIDPQMQAAVLANDYPRLEALLNVTVTRCPLFSNDGQDDESALGQCA